MPLPHYIAYRRPRERKPQYAVGSAAAPRTLFVKMFATLPFLCLFLYKICCLGFFPCSMRYARSNLRQLKFTETQKKRWATSLDNCSDAPHIWGRWCAFVNQRGRAVCFGSLKIGFIHLLLFLLGLKMFTLDSLGSFHFFYSCQNIMSPWPIFISPTL